MKWKPIDSVPKTGEVFLVLIGGIPYKAKYDAHGRFIWYMHTDCGQGAEYRVHDKNGARLLEQTRVATPRYEPNGVLWRDGMEDKPTHWTEYSEPPQE